MTLYEYIRSRNDGEEITVCDNEYDMESYFYNDDPEEDDDWQKAMLKLSRRLDVVEVKDRCVIVNLSDVVKRNIENLKRADLFTTYNIDAIMSSMPSILSGNVSEKWMMNFANELMRGEGKK